MRLYLILSLIMCYKYSLQWIVDTLALWARRSDWMSGCIASLFIGVSIAQRSTRQAHLLLMRLFHILCLTVQCWPILLWGLFNKTLQVTVLYHKFRFWLIHFAFSSLQNNWSFFLKQKSVPKDLFFFVICYRYFLVTILCHVGCCLLLELVQSGRDNGNNF